MVVFTYDEYVAADIVSALGDEDISVAKSLADAALSKKRSAQSLLGMVLVLATAGDASSAKELLEEGLELATKAKDKAGEAAALKLAGMVLAVEGAKSKAAEEMDKAIAIYKEKKNKAGEAAVLATKSKLSIPKKDTDLTFANEALTLFKDIKDTKGLAFVYGIIIDAKLKEDKASQALNVADELCKLMKDSKDPEGEATALILLSQVQLATGNAQAALLNSKEAAEIYSKQKKTSKKGSAIHSIAHIFSSVDMFDDALKATKSSISLAKESKDKRGHAAALCMEATIYDSMRKYSKAAHKLEKAASFYRMLKDKAEEAKTLESAAQMCLKTSGTLDDVAEPATLAQRAITLYSEIGMAESVETAYCLQTLAFALMLCGKPNEAFDKAKDSLAIFQEKSNLSGESSTLAVLAQLHWEMDDKQEAERMASRASATAFEAGDDGEKAWADALLFKYSGKEAEKEKRIKQGGNTLASTGGDTANVTTSTVWTYFFGKHYSILDGFQMRGVQEAPKRGAAKGSSSVILAKESKSDALSHDIDFSGLSTI